MLTRCGISPKWPVLALALGAILSGRAEEKPVETATPEKAAPITLSADVELIKTGHLELDLRGGRSPLGAPVVVTVHNHSGKPADTAVALTGKDAERAEVVLEKTDNEEDRQVLHLSVWGQRPTFEDSEVFLSLTTSQDGEVKAEKKIPVRVVVPMVIKLEKDRPFYEGAPSPGLVNRAVNNRTIPKIAMFYPEARLASLLLHDMELTVLDQFQEPLPPIYEGAPIFSALGESNYENTLRRLRADGTFLDTMGLWQFVGEVKDITVEPGRSQVQAFVSQPAPPCTKKQYATYEALTVQWQVGGYVVGTYRRQLTVIDTGNDHKPDIKITLELQPDPEPPKKDPQ